MKFISQNYRESQTDWFGKRGISWRVTVAMGKGSTSEESCETLTLVMFLKAAIKIAVLCWL